MNDTLLAFYQLVGGQTDAVIHNYMGIIICLIVFVFGVWLYTQWHIRRAALRLTAANESLSMSIAKYEAILDSMMSGVVCYDSNGVVIDINEKALELYGITDTKAEFLARRLSCDVNPNLTHFDMGHILRGNSFSGVIEYDFDSINQTGFYHTIHSGKRLHEVKISPIFNKGKNFKGFIILLNDITEFSRNQKELEESRRKAEEASLMLSSVLSQTPCAMFIKDVEDDYRYIVSNKIFSDYQQKKESDIVGKTDFELFSSRDADKFRHDDEASVANNTTYSFAEDVVWCNRPITWYTTKAVITTTNGRRLLVGVCQDITESMKRQKELEASKMKTDMAIATGGIMPWEYDCTIQEFIVDEENPLFRMGQLMLVKHPAFASHADKAAIFRALRMMSEGRDESFTLNIKYRIDGSSEWQFATVAGSPFERDGAGKVVRYLGFHKDTTEWARLNEEIDKSNMLLNNFINEIPLGLYVKDIDDDFSYVVANSALKKTNFLESSDLIGKTDYEVFDQPIADLFRRQNVDVVNHFEGKSIISRSELPLKGELQMFDVIDTVITMSSGHRFLLGIVIDITEKERNRIELIQAKESDKLKSAFLANMSHEIRTPLNAIVGFSTLLSETEDEEDKAEFSHIIQTNSDLLLRLIGDILDLSKVEAGMVDFKTERFDMVPYFNELSKSLKQRITNPDIQFFVDNPYSSCMINFDKGRMAQIITNYVTNAFKFTVSGYVTMGYSYVDGGIRIYVTDTGTGIPKEKQSKVFQRFEKLNEFAQGTGLGLSICKAITEARGGRVGFESVEGKGSTFWAWNACGEIDCSI